MHENRTDILTVTPIKVPVTEMRKVCPSNLNRGKELNSCAKVTFYLSSFSLIKTDYNTIWKQFRHECQMFICLK